MNEWPADWDERKRGTDCAMCSSHRADEDAFGLRIFAGEVSDAYLQRADVGQRGYTIVIWRGRHVADPTELSDDEASRYFAEVLRVGRALETRYHPMKLNFEMLGNSLPHLHTHVVPRYADDGSGGKPARFLRANVPPARLPDDELAREASALRTLVARPRTSVHRPVD